MKELITLYEVMALLGMSRSTLFRYRTRDDFPVAVQLGPRKLFWVKSEIEAWRMGFVENREMT